MQRSFVLSTSKTIARRPDSYWLTSPTSNYQISSEDYKQAAPAAATSEVRPASAIRPSKFMNKTDPFFQAQELRIRQVISELETLTDPSNYTGDQFDKVTRHYQFVLSAEQSRLEIESWGANKTAEPLLRPVLIKQEEEEEEDFTWPVPIQAEEEAAPFEEDWELIIKEGDTVQVQSQDKLFGGQVGIVKLVTAHQVQIELWESRKRIRRAKKSVSKLHIWGPDGL